MSNPLLSLCEVAARQSPPVNPITVIRRAAKDPAFPAPRKIGSRWWFDALEYAAYERRREAAS